MQRMQAEKGSREGKSKEKASNGRVHAACKGGKEEEGGRVHSAERGSKHAEEAGSMHAWMYMDADDRRHRGGRKKEERRKKEE